MTSIPNRDQRSPDGQHPDGGNADRVDHIRAMAAEGRRLVAEAHARGQQALDDDRRRAAG